jgi:excinuclease UvrABC nuclease subunit
MIKNVRLSPPTARSYHNTGMPEIATLLDQHVSFDPDADFEAFLSSVPGKWAIYLFVDAEGQPVQLLCVKNLRYSLKRRLGGDETIGLTKRVNYRELVRGVRWRRVDSAFEADWLYYEAARIVFPQTYRGMVGFRPSWFIHINPAAMFPRYVKTTDLSRSGVLAGPVADKHAAARLIAHLEDAFDLCRYYQILVEAPHGKACAYKEMGKCPAPCDGSISMSQYHRLIQMSVDILMDPAPAAREQEVRMREAAAALQFELAMKIKAYAEQLAQLGKGAFRHVRRLRDFQFLAVQPGPRTKTAKVFLILPGHIGEIMGLTGLEAARPSQILGLALEIAARRAKEAADSEGAERIGIVAHHLFSTKQTSGSLLALASIDEKAIARACRDVQQREEAAEVEEEGLVRELQSMGEGANRHEGTEAVAAATKLRHEGEDAARRPVA